MLIYLFMFLLVGLFPIISIKYKIKNDIYIYVFYSILLVLFAGLRGDNVDRDYLNYVNSYAYIEYFTLANQEPLYFLIVYFVRFFFDNVIFLFLIYALLSVILKIIVIKKYAEDYAPFVLLLYFSSFFPLHEMTQIRAAVAIGVMLFSIQFIVGRKPVKYFMSVLVAIMFHYSALLMIPLYFINTNKTNKKRMLIMLLFSLLIPFASLNVVKYIINLNLGFYANNFTRYIYDMNNGLLEVNVYNYLSIFYLLFAVYLILNIEKIKIINIYSLFFVKLYVYSIVAYFALSGLGVGNRISEFYGVSIIFVIPYFMMQFKSNYMLKILFVLIALFYLYLNIVNNSLLNEYKTIFHG